MNHASFLIFINTQKRFKNPDVTCNNNIFELVTGEQNAHYGNIFQMLTHNAAGVSRRQDQNLTNLVKNVNILEFGYYI